jgi:pimeloyl-ACP methyl ester carboxylesterase
MSGSRSGGTRFAIRNNARIAYDPGSFPDSHSEPDPVVVVLHDLLADRSSFTSQRAFFASDARVIAPDARGHGASATLANQWYTIAELAQDVVAILEVELVPAVHLVGHGLGGVTAFEIARRYGERVRTLTLVEPSLFGVLDNDLAAAAVGVRNELRATDRTAADYAYKGLLDKALDTYTTPRWGTQWRATATKQRLGAIRRHAAALSGLLPALDAYTIAKPELRRFLVPTLIVTGDDAHPVVRLTAERFAALLPAVKAISLPLGDRVNSPLSGAAGDALNAAIADLVLDR